ncbi:MAG: NADH dehydrogenase (quinone) subunit D [Caldilinea sp.]|nr:NADH-quinone oxidoreductase subunit D [Caldilineaceae bacterium]MCB9125250.1 NADH-quinone oxidoreductase subunit D [Caldilineaceae bacterium]MCO5209708.1 NADH dehydrogenase (quinone) subunit D [Caldilinea sp.]MCW5843127.1 NADH-quinone oxidoreductase subunit D [Caldilinea sp.]
MLNVSPRQRPYETLPGLTPLGIPAVAPLPAGESDDTQRLVERFGDAILAAGMHHGQQVVYVKPEQLVALAEFAKSDPKLQYEAIVDVSSVDRSELPADGARFHAVYQLRSYARKQHLMVVCPADEGGDPEVPSLAGVYKGAIWPEREVWDLMGVRFAGHPDHRRIMMPESWPNHPLQKQVPVGGEEVPFTLTWSDPEFESFGKQVMAAESLPPVVPPGMSRENMIINMGPHHPSTHGVLRLVVELDGETVVNVDPDLGYLHSGFEKTGENKRYKDFVYYTDRMDYLSAMSNNLGYCVTVEKLLGIDIPERAERLRVIMAELQRVASHLFWLSTHALDVSGTGMALLMYATRERERILDLFEMACGARLTVGYMRIGGVSRDIPPAFLGHLEEFLRAMPIRISEYESMLTHGPLWEERLRGIGKLTRDEVINMGLTGPMLRGSGVDWDLRRDAPYSGYEKYDFKVPVFTEGDSYARYLVRMEEMRQSLRIIRQAIDNLPDGPYRVEDRKVTPPPRAELDVSMEALIHHFKLMTEGFQVPPGMYYHGIESSKGELGFFVYSDGSAKPYRLHVRGPSFNNLYAVSKMSKGAMLSDIVTNIGSIDIVLGEVDR